MKQILLAALLCVASLVPVTRADTQLVSTGNVGVAMGHLHLTVNDLEGHRRFWAALGGVPVTNAQLQLIQFPGVFVMLRQAEPAGGMAGTTVDHLGFAARNMEDAVTRWRNAGLTMHPTGYGNQVMLLAPDGVRVEIVEDATLDVPLRMHHIHFQTPAPADTQAWYVKTFGAVAKKQGQVETAELPGVTLIFSRAAAAPAPTRGRALDHVGFEIKDLEAFVKKLEAAGVKMDRPFRRLDNSKVTLAFLTDPWGTNIELNEHLAPEGW